MRLPSPQNAGGGRPAAECRDCGIPCRRLLPARRFSRSCGRPAPVAARRGRSRAAAPRASRRRANRPVQARPVRRTRQPSWVSFRHAGLKYGNGYVAAQPGWYAQYLHQNLCIFGTVEAGDLIQYSAHKEARRIIIGGSLAGSGYERLHYRRAGPCLRIVKSCGFRRLRRDFGVHDDPAIFCRHA